MFIYYSKCLDPNTLSSQKTLTSIHSSPAPPFLDSKMLCFIRLTLEALVFFNGKVIREVRAATAAAAVLILLCLSAWQKSLYFPAWVQGNSSTIWVRGCSAPHSPRLCWWLRLGCSLCPTPSKELREATRSSPDSLYKSENAHPCTVTYLINEKSNLIFHIVFLAWFLKVLWYWELNKSFIF